MAEDRKINVPEGKELWDSTGIYRYVGPRVVLPSKGRTFTTYTDGSPLEYVSDAKQSDNVKNVEVKRPVFNPFLAEKTDTKKIVEPIHFNQDPDATDTKQS